MDWDSMSKIKKQHTAYFSLRDILPNVLIETKYHEHRIDIKLTMDVSQQFLSCYTNYWRDCLKGLNTAETHEPVNTVDLFPTYGFFAYVQ